MDPNVTMNPLQLCQYELEGLQMHLNNILANSGFNCSAFKVWYNLNIVRCI